MAGLLLAGAARVGNVQAPPAFASLVAQLSEPGGYFDTDNLISNERSYLHVVPALRDPGLAGGAYIGVGPDQNFSYIAQVRPGIAFIVDLRRDNLLLHLVFKALFSMSETRVDYLSLLFGRAIPPKLADWRRADLDAIIDHVAGPRLPEAAITELRERVDARIESFGLSLSEADLATIDRFHRRFISAGLALKFQTTGRQPQSYYPTYRDLLIETDRQLQRRNYLASEDDFQFVRSLQQRDLVVPVVGDLAGPSALAAIGRPDDVARRPPLRLLCVERRVLPVRRRHVSGVRRQPEAAPAPRSKPDHPLGVWRPRPVGARLLQLLARSAGGRTAAGIRRGPLPPLPRADRVPITHARKAPMPDASSFDITSTIDFQEVDNALNQARKEVGQRYDFKGATADITLNVAEKTLTLLTDDEMKMNALWEMVQTRLVRRGVAVKNFKSDKSEAAASGKVRRVIPIQQGIPIEAAKEIVKFLKDAKLKKVQASIQADQVRVSSPSKDELQSAMKALREHDFGVALQFGNYR